MEYAKDDLRTTVEVGSLALGASAVAFPALTCRIAGADPRAGLNKDSARMLGFWLTAYGALLRYADTEAERERLFTAGAAVGSAYCLNMFMAAKRGAITWRGAFTEIVTVGALSAAACLYLSE